MNRNRARLWRQGMDHLSAWLPALMMVLFALATWWLVRSAPQFDRAPAATVVSREPDYFMRQFSVRAFDPSGRLKSEIVGSEGQHYPANDQLQVQQPRIRSFDEQGRPTVATAQRALAKGDGSEVELFGNAHVVRDEVPRPGSTPTPRLEFIGEYLHTFVDAKRVQSDKPVELRRGRDVFTGDAFSYDERSGVGELTGRVRGTLPPR
ncbi:LPS export ABC transporter periplasmic protein LptC [Ottowia sp.]|uniref:LPS export ABC transporter periplasmic protein LptC n=1 Tax=Ottowia sp. TaxID=1898956 RepID=UPI002B7F4947|nr:LPS export ABC transporter periplasmic protein LptC [Ottowia sp.]HOB65147.1 LPS export ABC transporter periplasmic protein LptC [Ottowia sp.]HQD46616.1 LPS export ABC transporter periplasmic protein LptC [Ottowia sp.]